MECMKKEWGKYQKIFRNVQVATWNKKWKVLKKYQESNRKVIKNYFKRESESTKTEKGK